MFELDPKLKEDTVFVYHLALCDVRLMCDANYPWVILIPRRNEVTEIYQLSGDDQLQLLRESSGVSQLLSMHYVGDKMNIAALGNQVRQLHVHHVVRYRNDLAWPNPVWGYAPAKKYSDDEQEMAVTSLKVLIEAHKEALLN